MNTVLDELFGKAVHSYHPIFASIELTYDCNLACRFCYNPVERKNQTRNAKPKQKTEEPLSFVEIVDLFDQLREMNVLYLTLTGGEPILHPRFWEIAREAKKRAFAVRVFSNGVLIDEKNADRFAELAPYCIEMSLHGTDAETAEAMTQVKGSFDRQMRALALLKERNVRVFLKCVVTNLLEHKLAEMKALADDLGYPIYFDPVITISDDGERYPLEYLASDDALLELFSDPRFNVGNSPFEKEPGTFNCTVGAGTIHIGPFGDVQPCVQWKEAVGNIREKSLKGIWDTSELLKEVREINRNLPESLKQTMGDSGYCFCCPGLGRLTTGDPMRPDDQYLRVARLKRRAFELA